MSATATLLLALLLDGALGDPSYLWQRIPHPAALMGRMVARAERALNRGGKRRAKGILAIVLLVATAVALGLGIRALPGGGALALGLCAVLLAQNSLARHVMAVARGLEYGLPEGRRAVAMIVGRDVTGLDENGVVRGAVESVAENFSDGVVAPAFWFLLLGLPGILAYKMINTADSMIGYRNARFARFGWAAARLDDLVNWIPARISGALICLSHGSIRAARVMLRDAPLHRSPNAGWPEAATAALVGIAISGPRVYDGVTTDQPYVNAEGRHILVAADIKRAVRVIWRAWAVGVVVLTLAWLAGDLAARGL